MPSARIDVLTPEDKDTIRKLPKVDLHLHLDGAARPETLMEFMRAAGGRLPTADPGAFRKYVQVPRTCRSLTDFLKAFEFFYPFLKSAEAVERLAYELCEDCARLNVRCFEARFAPALQARDGFVQEEVVRAALRGAARGEKDFSVRAGLILCLYRSLSEAENKETVRLASAFLGKGVVGVDLAGDESRYPVRMYADFFREARDNGVPVTCHAGEADGPESIRQALDLGACRIGHGVRLREDPALLGRVRESRIPLEMCLTSNVQTQAVKGYAAHPAKRYLEEGVLVTLNTDDPGVSGIDIAYEYEVAMEKLNFTWKDLTGVILNGVDNLFRPASEKKSLRAEFEREIEKLLPAGADFRPAA